MFRLLLPAILLATLATTAGGEEAEPAKGAPDAVYDTLLQGTVGRDWGDAVSTAGDVNGDGFSDVLVGAPAYGNGQFVEGRVSLYYGSAQGVATTPAWNFESNVNFAQLGWSVAPCGDTNGDGYDDFVVGAPGVSNGHTNEGRIYVFGGSASGPSLLATFELDEEDARFGHVVAWAGDVNGDGYDEVLAGAPEWGGFGSPFFVPVQGAAALYYGGPSGPQSAGKWSPTGGQTGCEFGFAVAGVGDVNNDGFADVIVGAPGFDPGFVNSNHGTARLYLGSASGLGFDVAWSRNGSATGARLGAAVAWGGDWNGDDFSDVLLGSPGVRIVEFHRGHPTQNLTYSGGVTRLASQFGATLAGVGDYDGDGYADQLLGGGSDHNVLIYTGGSTSPSIALILAGGSEYGDTVASAGDVNGDGLSDWLISDPLADGGAGRVYVFHGESHYLDSTVADFVVNGSTSGLHFGQSVAAFGDPDRDGYDDFVIGGPGAGASGEGRIQRMRGTSGLGLQVSWSFHGTNPGGEFGFASAAAGDVNGDGYEDLVVGEPGSDTVHVFHGPLETAPGAPDFSYTYSLQLGSRFGAAVDGAGDMNGDGYADIVVGAPLYDGTGRVDNGAVFFFFGSPEGITTAGSEGRQQFESGMQLGASVAGVGDGDGDGFDDVAVGAPNYDLGLTDRGGLFVYFGAEDGLNPTPFGTSGPSAGDHLGHSVAAAGDVDGDGLADIVVGLPGRDRNGVGDTGEAWILMGKQAEVPYLTKHVLPPPTETGGEQFGLGVSGAGDLGGHGFTAVGVASIRPADGYGRVDFFGVREGGPTYLRGKQTSAIGQGACVTLVGDLDGDSFPELALGLPNSNASEEGGVWLMSAHVDEGGSVPSSVPELRRVDGTPVALRGLVPDGEALELAAEAWMPNGRARLRLEWQAAAGSAPFGAVERGTWVPTATAAALTTSLVQPIGTLPAGSAYRWRMRVGSSVPFHPHGRWISHARGSSSLYGLRVVDTATAVGELPGPYVGVRMQPAYPNPFNPSTTVAFTLPSAGEATLRVFDLSGREVRVLHRGRLAAGVHRYTWDGRDARGGTVASGVYFAVLDAAAGRESQKLVLVK